MNTDVFLARYLGYRPFSGKAAPESSLCLEINNNLTLLAVHKKLRGVYIHVPNEAKRSKCLAGLLTAMGMRSGAADYVHTMHNNALWIEVKTKKGEHGAKANGKQQDSQKHFQQWCELWNVSYALVRSWEEYHAALYNNGFIVEHNNIIMER